MSELIQKNDNRATIRWKLLTGASALALTAYVSSGTMVMADDSGRPQIWIELGGQLSRLDDGLENFVPPLMDGRPSIFSPSQKFERPPLWGIDGNAALSFRPDDSSWVFSASIRYGRSASARNFRQQTHPGPFVSHYLTSGSRVPATRSHFPFANKFADTRARTSEHHAILDFQAGKDVGLGMFGIRGGSSVVNAGVRFAQFTSKSNITLKSDPDWHFHYKYIKTVFPSFPSSYIPIFFPFGTKRINGQAYHSNIASLQASRSFHGVGPSLSWTASAPFAGDTKDGELSFDWSINAAMLFGRQRTKVQHQTTGRYHPPATTNPSNFFHKSEDIGVRHVTYQPTPVHLTRSRNITVPNFGGSIGLTYQMENFKMSFGYKADFFFNAIDGGIDARKNENRGFFGPYASISIGLGD